jgi:hypothetical protein
MALTLPTFASGTRVRASALTQIVAALNALTPLSKIKGADQAATSNSTTPADDNHLFVALAANTTYEFDCEILYVDSAGSSVDLKIQFTKPSGSSLSATLEGAHVNWNASASAVEIEFASWTNETGTTTSTKAFGSATTVFGIKIQGTIQVGATPGNLRLQFSQNTASAVNNVTVKYGSSLVARVLP